MRVLRIVASQQLSCGCLVGVYETYRGRIVQIVDHRAPRCMRHHWVGQSVDDAPTMGSSHREGGRTSRVGAPGR
jgi:hypothetical protein